MTFGGTATCKTKSVLQGTVFLQAYNQGRIAMSITIEAPRPQTADREDETKSAESAFKDKYARDVRADVSWMFSKLEDQLLEGVSSPKPFSLIITPASLIVRFNHTSKVTCDLTENGPEVEWLKELYRDEAVALAKRLHCAVMKTDGVITKVVVSKLDDSRKQVDVEMAMLRMTASIDA